MRVESRVMSLSWIPSESLSGYLRLGFEIGLGRYDDPPPETAPGHEHIDRMCRESRFRFANVLHGWADFEDGGRPVAWGFGDESLGYVSSSTVHISVARARVTFDGFALPTLRPDPEVSADGVRFTQTVGGRTGSPLPRPVPHPPFVRWHAPIVWTTLALTLRPDGSTIVELPGASAFPRHWVYGSDGQLLLKSGVTDLEAWQSHSFGSNTPWGAHDSPTLVSGFESALERRLSTRVMRGERVPEYRRLSPGTTVTRQGDRAAELYLVLDGILRVDVDDVPVAELGPGAVLGERAILEGGERTATVECLTPTRIAVVPVDAIDIEALRALSQLHQREHSTG
ncbi:cyclic nucleotide-binding domain-containing protein [Puerhibacterium puerhi]|uniref:cyclic nucleotide-binding domain-containing protein n=1 Tax=Puerhibacterium puerhi TaxID=2692623 RepID=UPI00135A9058|nr:cyclic nucleotide-binding domain-containing protein [Puerhibacterium puerhi]